MSDFTVTPPPPTTPEAAEGERKPSEAGMFASLYARAREALKGAMANDTSRDSAAANAVRPLDGTVSVDADGGPAMITVDGVPMGTTPATLHLLPGRHTVAVHGARSYTPSEVVVTVTRGGKTGASFRAMNR